MRSFRPLLLLISFGLLITACGRSAQPVPPNPAPAATGLRGEIIVFAAASLGDVFEAIAVAFTAANPGTRISFNFAGSQQLAAQINAGAPADVFASADVRQLRTVIEAGRISAGSEQPFVRNQLVLITPADNPGAITTLQDLARPGLRLILADEAVPVGQHSRNFLTKASAQPAFGAAFAAAVLANVVSFEENVRSVLTKIMLGEGDAGIVYTTDAALEAANLQQITIPAELNTIAVYPIAPINDSANPTLAEAFIAFVRSNEGQAILVNYGFLPIE
ncbi:MAG: molybdate ABC transporter substrate-binding protein [Oscillochloridaceae bacterium umkhey_bin13]